MNDPVQISVTLHGPDIELQAANACVQLLETQTYYAVTGIGPLTAEQRARIAAYLVSRYPKASA